MSSIARSIIFLVFIIGTPAKAALVKFTDQALYMAALGSDVITESFDSIADGTIINDGSTVNGITIGFDETFVQLQVTDDYDTVSGNHSLGTTSGGLIDLWDVVSFSFDKAIDSFGLYLILSDVPLEDEVFLNVSGEIWGIDPMTQLETYSDGGLGFFIGFVADSAFTELSLSFLDDGSSNFEFTVDDISYSVVPEPRSILLLGLLLLAIVSGRKLFRNYTM